MVNKFEPLVRWSHSAVRLNNYVVMIGGRGSDGALLSPREIWVYNLYTEEWRKYVITRQSQAPDPFESAVVAVIDGTIYTFGGYDKVGVRNALWNLSRTNCKRGYLKWSFIEPRCKEESPSPRYGHTGWEFNGKLYTFGGEGHSPNRGYLNDHGDNTNASLISIKNNQLLCYDPNIQTWMNPQCLGTVPLPRSGHCSTICEEKVWLFGGRNEDLNCFDDFFELSMSSLTWSQIQTHSRSPQARYECTLTATAENQLVLNGGSSNLSQFCDTWIMDLTTHSWRRYTPAHDHTRSNHAATVGLNNSVIIIGGRKSLLDEYDGYDVISRVMLKPESLQKFALHTVYRHGDQQRPLKLLPQKLTALLDISEK